jgi:hypothetical protein
MMNDETEEPNYPLKATAWEKRAKKAEEELKKLQEINDDKTIIVEQRAKIDVRTNLLRASLGVNTGLIAGLLVHFLAGC